MNEPDPVEALGKASKRAALMSLLGVIVVLASFGYSAYQLRTLEDRKKQLQDEKKQLEDKKTQLEGDIEEKTKQQKALITSIQELNYTKISSQGQVFQIKASAKGIPGQRNTSGNPVYDFTVFVDASKTVLGSIAKVTYVFDHPSFPEPNMEATEASSKFAVKYRGWGCLTKVNVTVHFKDGTTQPLPFNMCKSLGPGWS